MSPSRARHVREVVCGRSLTRAVVWSSNHAKPQSKCACCVGSGAVDAEGKRTAVEEEPVGGVLGGGADQCLVQQPVLQE
jgi:hypothetical protein